MESIAFRQQIKDTVRKLRYLLDVWGLMTDQQQYECMDCMDVDLQALSRLLGEFDVQNQSRYTLTDLFVLSLLCVWLLCASMFMGRITGLEL